MRPLFVHCTLSVLLLLASTIDARKNLEEYWRIVMKGQPMPESVQDLLAVGRAASTDNVQPSDVETLAKNFNQRPNILVYGFHNSHNDQPSEMSFNSRPNFLQHDSDNSHNNQQSEVKSFSENFIPRPNLFFYSFHNSHNDQPSQVKSFDKDVLKPDSNVDANA